MNEGDNDCCCRQDLHATPAFMGSVSYNDKHLGTVEGRFLDEELFVFNYQKDPTLRFIDLELNN